MSCTSLLTQSVPLDCSDNTGGIEEILIANVESVEAFTEASGTVSAITQAVSTSFYRYELEEQDADYISTENKALENGTLFYTTVLNFTIDKLTATKNEELRLMAAARNLVVIWKNNDGSYQAMGLDKVNSLPGGAKKIGGTNTAASGKAFGDKTGYSVTLTAMESHYPYFVDSSVVSGLTIA